jgi:4-hydroxy-3-polyprenylbenzoate decarboxylase
MDALRHGVDSDIEMSTGRLIVGVTGASGAIYAQRFLRHAARAYDEVHLILSSQAIDVALTELGAVIDPARFSTLDWLGEELKNILLCNEKDYFTPPASGSFLNDGMVVVPCSMGSAGRIANGVSDNLLTRAADVCLKEGRKLIIVPREMPMNVIMLRNLATLAEAGATVIPACPAWYHRPSTLEELADSVVARILQNLGLEQRLFGEWMKTEKG